jgi:hypothetical protein
MACQPKNTGVQIKFKANLIENLTSALFRAGD